MPVKTELDRDYQRELERELRHEEEPEPRQIPGHVCRCGAGNEAMPGRCPGWHNCPMWDEDV